MKNTLRKLKIRKVALVDAGAGKGVRVELWKRRDDAGKVRKMNFDELMAALAALTDEQKAQALAALGEAPMAPTEEEKQKMADDEKMDEMAKARKAGEDAMAVELKKRDERIAKLEADAARSALTARVEKSMRAVEGETSEIVETLLSITDEKIRETVAKKLEAASAEKIALMEKAGMLKALGSKLAGGGSSPSAEFDAEVSKVMTGEGVKRRSEAVSLVAKRRPELYTAAREAEKAVS